jgi:hypothetical protein
MFRFQEGQSVALRSSRPDLGLKAGAVGIVWAIYDIDSPEYEVTFRGLGGEAFDITLAEEDIVDPSPSESGQVPTDQKAHAA